MINSKHYSSGIVVLWTDTSNVQAFCDALAAQALAENPAIAFIYYSSFAYQPQLIVDLLKVSAPQLNYCGCSTSGEITPDGIQEHGAYAVLLPEKWFTVCSSAVENVDAVGMHAIAQHAKDQRAKFDNLIGVEQADKAFAITLIDGLTYAEDAVTSALCRGLGFMPLIGGSAADDLGFEKTTQICNGRVYSKSAILTLVHCALPFELYTENNFLPTNEKLVVTESDPEKRTVYEFNAEPAAKAYAHAIGVDVSELGSSIFASNSVVVRVGGEYHCRSMQQLNSDNSVTFFSAIDNGVVLTVAKTEGMVRSMQQAVERIEHSVGQVDMMMGFECIYRKLDATHRNVIERMETLYKQHNIVAFNSYGEQFQSMHINQTFTGVAFGVPDESTNKQ